MAGVAFIIGNGFDIDMGLPSRYSDFARSKEFRDLADRMYWMFREEESDHSLVLQLQKESAKSNWFDIEEEIHKYVNNHTTLEERHIGLVRAEFEELKKALAIYLRRITSNFKADENKLSWQLYYRMRECPLTVTQIFFNYTNPRESMNLPLQPEIFNGGQHWFTYVHGSLKDNDIVLGCDLQPNEKVNRQLSFMYKYNQLNRANHVARNILEAKEIIFFGHSVNEMDFGYFKEFFRVASSSPNPVRHLTMITYDDESERIIKDNIRNQGISVTDLYSNLCTFDFIHTSKVYANDKEEFIKWERMINRLLSKDRHGI